MQIQDKRVVVTGAASGIGKALCEAFKNAQAQSIFCVDMNLEGATKTANEVGGIAVQANVGKESDIVNVIEKANEHSGGIDIFCSNAGIGGVHGFFEVETADWQNILLARAAELVPGGRFICLNFGIDAEGRYLGNTGGKHMFDHFHKFWRALYEKGSITKSEYEGATFVQYYRTMEEFCAPFSDPNSDVSRAGLVLKSSSTKLTKCPYEAAFHDAGEGMSNREYAESLIPTMRSWSETVFKTALKGRDSSEINKIVDDFYQAYSDEVAADPKGHAMDYVHIILDIEKTTASMSS